MVEDFAYDVHLCLYVLKLGLLRYDLVIYSVCYFCLLVVQLGMVLAIGVANFYPFLKKLVNCHLVFVKGLGDRFQKLNFVPGLSFGADYIGANLFEVRLPGNKFWNCRLTGF